jgi:hypothetical protein
LEYLETEQARHAAIRPFTDRASDQAMIEVEVAAVSSMPLTNKAATKVEKDRNALAVI